MAPYIASMHSKIYYYISQLRTLRRHSSIYVFVINACMSFDFLNLGPFFFYLDVGACIFIENGSIEIFNISFESTQNKHQY